jgi:hypothetical protein
VLAPTAVNSRLLAFAAAAFLASIAPSRAACNIVNGKAFGDCEGVRINEGIKRHLTVRSYTFESGIIEGATVLRGGQLVLSGISNGDITIHEGARLLLTGIVNGTVNNLGGSVEIEGSLEHLRTTGGQVLIGGIVGSISGPGPTTYKKGAVIGGAPVDEAVHERGKR